MQNQLIPVVQSTINNEEIPTVNARELHCFLGIGRDFSSWIKDQIERARLIENRDYLLTEKGEQLPSGMKYLKEYHLTIESGKHIAMMSQTDKGFEVRDYFIECEKQVKQRNESPQMLMARALIAADATIKQQIEYIAALEPKAAFYDAVAESSDLILMREAAKILAVPNLGQNTLFFILRNLKVLMENNEPYQSYIDRGYFMVRERQYHVKNECRIARTTMVTQKGLDFLRRLVCTNMEGGRMKDSPVRWIMPKGYMIQQ